MSNSWCNLSLGVDENPRVNMAISGANYNQPYELPTMSTTLKGGAKVGEGLAIDENEQLNIEDGAISAAKLGDGAITTPKLADGAVTLGKLDVSVSDLFAGNVRAFDTVADMQAETLEAGDVCHTNGFHTAGDGGAAFYKVAATGTANGMDVIALENGLYAVLVKESMILNAKSLGLYCFETESDAKSASADKMQFNNNIQSFIESGFGIYFEKGYYPFDDYINLKNSIVIDGDTEAYLVFPNSDGLCVNRPQAYTNYMYIGNVNIISNGHCFNFQKNSQNYNVYISTIENMLLLSETGDCFNAGTNKSGTNDTLVFQVHFSNIGLAAPNGHGFNNIQGVGITFDKIYDRRQGINHIFHNSCGHITNFNGTFGAAKWFMYYDVNTSTPIEIDFHNCNIESFVDGAIYLPNNCFITVFILHNVSFYHTKQSSLKTVHPWRLGTLNSVVSINGLKIYNPQSYSWNDIYDTSVKESTFYIQANSSPGGNMPGNITYQSGTNYVLQFSDSIGNEQNSYLTPYNTMAVPKHKEMHSDVFVGQRLQVVKELSAPTSGTYIIFNVTDRTIPDVINFKDTSAAFTINKFSTLERWANRLITFFNSSSNNVTIGHGTWDGFTNIVTEDNQNIVLKQNDFVVFRYIALNNSIKYLTEVERHIS